MLEAGLRFNSQYQNARSGQLGSDSSFTFRQNSLTLSGGTQWTPLDALSLKLHFGTNVRPPAINERFSNGLHHGSARIEEGDVKLEAERSWKIVNSISYRSGRLLVDLAGYYHHFNNYIYLISDSTTRLTVRGAFPVFSFRQVGASVYGADAFIQLGLFRGHSIKTTYSTVRGEDKNRNYLPYMPQDNWKNEYRITIDTLKGWREIHFSAEAEQVWQLDRANEVEDLLPPPEGYFLINLYVGGERNFFNNKWQISFEIENLLNIKYRNYLNAMRYFANERGRNLQLKIKWEF